MERAIRSASDLTHSLRGRLRQAARRVHAVLGEPRSSLTCAGALLRRALLMGPYRACHPRRAEYGSRVRLPNGDQAIPWWSGSSEPVKWAVAALASWTPSHFGSSSRSFRPTWAAGGWRQVASSSNAALTANGGGFIGSLSFTEAGHPSPVIDSPYTTPRTSPLMLRCGGRGLAAQAGAPYATYCER